MATGQTQRTRKQVDRSAECVLNPVRQAIKDRRPDLLLEEVKKNPDRRPDTGSCETLLHHAVELDSPELVEYCLSRGYDIEEKPFMETDTALTIAARWRNATHPNNATVIKVLIAHGADLYASGSGGYTPMGQAARMGNAEQVRFLAEQGVDIYRSVCNDQDMSPLRLAISWGRVEVIKALCDLGFDTSAKLTDGNTALHSLHSDSFEIVRLIVAAAHDIEARDELGQTALLHAAAFKSEWFVSVLLDKGADIEARDERKRTALIAAAPRKDSTMVPYLLERHADVNARDDHGMTALHWASRFGPLATVRALVAAGADPDARCTTNTSPLHILLNRPGFKEVRDYPCWRDWVLCLLSHTSRFDMKQIYPLSNDKILALIQADHDAQYLRLQDT